MVRGVREKEKNTIHIGLDDWKKNIMIDGPKGV